MFKPKNKIKKKPTTHTQKKTPSRCRAVIHVEIPGDESWAEPGLLEDSFSSVFSEHFGLQALSVSVGCRK